MSNRSEQEQIRFDKLTKMREQGFKFPNDVKVSAKAEDILKLLDQPSADLQTQEFVLAGRIVTFRLMGKAAFLHILDSSGKLQVYLKKDEIGEEKFEEFKHYDIGDIIEVRGYPFFTKTGEKSLHAKSVRILTKSLIPLPEKWHGLSDVEARYRHRYVDLIANHEVRDVFRKRSIIIREMRRFFDDRGFLEVETPILQSVTGGADARPFKTFHNTLNQEMYLRIATELPLKKLVVGGFDKVYEIGRIFRNEGVSKKHNPEFTSIEFYWAYADFNDLMNLTEELYVHLSKIVNGSTKIKYGDLDIDLAGPWPRLSMRDSIYEIGKVSRDLNMDKLEDIYKVAQEHHIKLEEKDDWGRCLEALWGELVEPRIVNPVFITNHPFSISPLARKNDLDPRITDRFELIIAGMEGANAFSELNDAQDQRQRFEGQAKRKAEGHLEANDVEEDFLKALEYGMPPTAGEGIGIDRLVMLLTNSASIRDVLFFPQLKND